MATIDYEIPQYAIEAEAVGPGLDGKPVIILSLVVTTSATLSKFLLCEATDNYQDIARQLHDKICHAGQQARRARTGLAVANGSEISALRTSEQGREQRPPRGPRQKGS